METLFHLTDGDPDAWRVAFRSVETLHQDPEIDPQPVVVSATAVYAVVAHAPVADEVRELLTDGVEFLACSNALGSAESTPRISLPASTWSSPGSGRSRATRSTGPRT